MFSLRTTGLLGASWVTWRNCVGWPSGCQWKEVKCANSLDSPGVRSHWRSKPSNPYGRWSLFCHYLRQELLLLYILKNILDIGSIHISCSLVGLCKMIVLVIVSSKFTTCQGPTRCYMWFTHVLTHWNIYMDQFNSLIDVLGVGYCTAVCIRLMTNWP